MPLIRVCTSEPGTRARNVIARMNRLKRARFEHRVTRKAFLVQWSKLRKALWLTREYQQLIDRVRARSGGVCEFCGIVPGQHLCHIERVVDRTDLALSDANVKWGCIDCHDSFDGR